MTLLKSSQSQRLSESSLQPDPPNSSPPRSLAYTSTFRVGEAISWPTPGFRTREDRTEEPSESPTHQPWQASYLPSLSLSNAGGDDLLYIYQSEMVGYFPFVIVPTGVAAQSLRTERPFLFAAIMLAASRQKIWSQTMTGNGLMESLSMRMLQKGEKSLDLLQGLLVYIAWFVLRLLKTNCGSKAA